MPNKERQRRQRHLEYEINTPYVSFEMLHAASRLTLIPISDCSRSEEDATALDSCAPSTI